MGSTISTNPSTVYSAKEGKRFAADTTLVVVHCAVCGVTYAIPDNFNRSALKYRGDRRDGWSVCCPFGHSWHYIGETETERLRRSLKLEREAAGRLAAECDQVKASLAATKGVVTRKKRELARVKNGVCPCCKRSFQDLRRHMESKHPGFKP